MVAILSVAVLSIPLEQNNVIDASMKENVIILQKNY
jgi:hypothetical protein